MLRRAGMGRSNRTMKLVAYSIGKWQYVGLFNAQRRFIRPFDVSANDAARGIVCIIDRMLAGRKLPPLGRNISLSDARLHAPIPRPAGNIFCVGKNYREHAQEFVKSGYDTSAGAGAIPDHPIVFSKLPQSVIATGEAIIIDRNVSENIDYEAELAVIIGKGGRSIQKARAMDHVWGYTIINDVTARDLQSRHKQWLLGKSQDTFCPMGPCAVTADEIDLADTTVTLHINGELRQNGNTSELIFDVPTLIATISRGITLIPGDIIATGTPAGVGIGFNPPKFLKPGDRVRIEVSGIGALENPVREAPQ
jgi:2-keto-4-pentenoate hydratase/2-oxohepta-3-ene-1,7-dioic acid hydratase in catechol pathway